MKISLIVAAGPHQGKTFEFEGHETFIVGRAKNAQFQLSKDDQFFSRNHFLIEINPPLCRLLDLNSRNGTFVNGQRVTSVDLQDGDKIRGGKTTISVSFQPVATQSAENHLVVGEATIVPRASARPVTNDSASSPPTISPRAAGSVASPPPALPPTNIQRLAETQDPPPDSLPQFPGYRTVRILGRGGMGTVYEANSDTDRSRVAIKVISTSELATSQDLNRFIREATILQQLVHPNIVGYRSLDRHDGSLFIVMDYIEGTNAQKLLADRADGLPIPRAVGLTLQLLEALSFAHERGYVHRDVKPANLLIATQAGRDRLSLADFGLARTYQASNLSGLTMTGEIGGTTPFMPPEQITNYRKVEPAGDQYSAAATLYYLLTKQHVYDFPRDVARQLLMVLQDDPIRIDTRRSDLPKKLVDVIHKALCRETSRRFSNVTEFRDALRAVKN